MERMYYSPTFKADVLAFYDVHRDAGWTAARVARKFKMNANTLRAWINEDEASDTSYMNESFSCGDTDVITMRNLVKIQELVNQILERIS